LHDNALAHWALATQKKLGFSRSGSIGLPPVPWTEKQLKDHHFSSNTEVIPAAVTW
jgi:hypothetical protein